MTDQHPITPPPELVDKWNNLPLSTQEIIAIAWRHGADTELDACCEWIDADSVMAAELRAARRPKPLSLAEEAEGALLHLLDGAAHSMDTTEPAEYIRRALERLQELEGGNG